MKELKQLENYYKNNEIDIDGIIEDFTPYITKIINNGTNNDISFEDKEEIFSDTFFILWKNRKNGGGTGQMPAGSGSWTACTSSCPT